MKQRMVTRAVVFERTKIGRKWYEGGELHFATNYPAVEYANGDFCYYVHDTLHRDHGKPAVKCGDFYQWFVYGKCEMSKTLK